MAASFQCTLVTPERQLFDEPVTYASIPAWDGQLGVMDRRSPLLVQLGCGRLRLEAADGGSRDYFVGGGFAQMKGGRLTLLTDEARPIDELDAEAAKAELAEVQSQAAAGDTQIERRRRKADRARAIAQLAAARR